MKYSKRVLISIVILLVVISSSSVIILTYLNTGPSRLEISFTPDSLNTIPDDVGWFLVEIDTDQYIVDYNVDISTNVSVDTDYNYWPETPLLEVFLYPNSSHIDLCIEINVTFSSGSLTASDTAQMDVLNWTASDLAYVLERKNVFIEYLIDNHPEFGITHGTEWTPIYNCAGILIVGHYLFLSDDWELEIDWHVMIPPYDWVRVYLRNRADLDPSWAGEIQSWSTNNTVVLEISPPEQIYRPA